MGVQIQGDTGNVIATKGTYSGNVTIGGTLTYEDVTNVDAVGLITARNGIVVGSGVIKIPDGSTAAPSIAASSDTNSGLYFAGADAVGLVAGGSRKLLANSSGITINNGDLSIDDKIIHSGDTNTAIRFPAADTITAETGGSERVRIDSSGRLLLGTTTEGQADADNLTIADSGSCGITIRSGTSAAGAIYFSDATSGAAEYDGAIVYNQSSQYMSVYTAQTQRLRINSNGSLNIQNTSGYNTYDVDISNAGATDTAVQIRPNDGNAGEAQLFIGGGGSSQNKCALIFDPAGGYCRGSLHICMENTGDTSNVDSSDNKLSISPEGYVTKPAQFHMLVRRNGNQTGYNPSQGFGTGITYDEVITAQGTASSALDTSNGRITVPIAGIYFLEGSGYSNTSAFTQGWFTKNGSRLIYSDWMNNSGASQNVNASGFHKLAANDTIGFKAYGSAHTSVTVEASIYHTWMRVTLVG